MATTLVNLTPHALNIHTLEGEIVIVPPSGTIARVSQETRAEGTITLSASTNVELSSSTFGEVIDLPAPEPDTIYVVSGLVLSALNGARPDVLAPGELVRDDNGRPVGCKGLRR